MPELRSRNAVFLAHVRHDPYAQGRAKSIYAQLGSRFPSAADPLGWRSFVKAGPWLEGPADLLVRGFWIGDESDRKFLALRVDGCSVPKGVPIRYVRGDAGKSSSGAAAKGNPVRYVTRRKASGRVHVTDRAAPGRGSPSIVFEDPPFEVLGKRRDVKQVKAGVELPVCPVKGTGSEPAAYSSSEPYSTVKGVYGISGTWGTSCRTCGKPSCICRKRTPLWSVRCAGSPWAGIADFGIEPWGCRS